ncbi:uncharacterized protein LOC136758952 [Amia ocellicauda]|uniref:uncharacterized protein LOC136758952 n=1 Tax=Amia ocellicauda TaxID=2972642 RepID=UPI0034641BDA
MKSGHSEDTSALLTDIWDDYWTYYREVWPKGQFEVCKEPKVTERAKHFVSESDPGERFKAFDFYRTVLACVEANKKECRDVLRSLIKATEFLETLCVNLFLFPWKKEIRTLKTFTGQFVYNIQPVLPPDVVKSILESIGYCLETDIEYRLSKNTDHTNAKNIGFELFLVRVECEHLLEVMGQNEDLECLQILTKRSSALHGSTGNAECLVDEQVKSNETLQNVVEEEIDRGCSPLNTVTALIEECPTTFEAAKSLQGSEKESHNIDAQISNTTQAPDVRQPTRMMSDDSSISEMRANYPDLAFRQKLIFRNTEELSTAQRKNAGDKGTAEMPVEAPRRIRDLSGPQSVTVFSSSPFANDSSSKSHDVPSAGEAVVKFLPQYKHSKGLKGCDAYQTAVPLQSTKHNKNKEDTEEQCATDDTIVSDLTLKFNDMGHTECHADENLKFPIEETSPMEILCNDHDKHKPQDSPNVLDCNFRGCLPTDSPWTKSLTASSCSGDVLPPNAIKEPPHSFYIPPSSMDNQLPVEEADDTKTCSHCKNSCNGNCHSSSKNEPLQTEDDLLKGYVFVEHEKK